MSKPIFWFPERPRLLHIDSTLFEIFSQAPDYVAERKYNGVNLEAVCYVYGQKKGIQVDFYNRHNQPINRQERFDALKEQIREAINKTYGNQFGNIILHGELRDGKVIGVREKIVFHDVLMVNNRNYSFPKYAIPFSERRKLLVKLGFPIETPGAKANGSIVLPCQFTENFRQVFKDVTKDPEIEGLVIKHLHGKLVLGLHEAVESKWTYKVRRPSKNYKF